jgi:hypothetical protein
MAATEPMDETSGIATTYTEPIVGWRLWRIRRLETLAGQRPPRLAAAGRLGIPKFWEPRMPTRAVCSSYRTSHEAPWPNCRCGIYGLRDRELAERALWKYSRGSTSNWALGRVSLWGRIVECEHGWRAEYAYPYDLVVFAVDATVGDELRDVYAVDVTVRPPRREGARARREAEHARARTRPGEDERRGRARGLHEAWLKGLHDAAAAGAALDEEQLAQGVGEAMRLRVQAASRLLIEELTVVRKLWDARG